MTAPTTASVLLAPDGGEQLRFLGASTMRLKLDGAANPDLAFYEYVSEPGVTGPPQHVHHAHDETFFVDFIFVHFIQERRDIILAGAQDAGNVTLEVRGNRRCEEVTHPG